MRDRNSWQRPRGGWLKELLANPTRGESHDELVTWGPGLDGLDPQADDDTGQLTDAVQASAGEHLSAYRLEGVLGSGSMGIVVLAVKRECQQPVAIKMIRPDCINQPYLVQAFLREARHMARLSHPNIVPVLEVSEHCDGPFYVMPYYPQGSLAQRIANGVAFEQKEICSVARQVAEALRFAHSHGSIHRDVKPSNILYDGGRVRLADFGLVRSLLNEASYDSSANWCVGTPAYMSPAVAAGEPEDTRCDVYSFGALLYAMLTGHPPYSAVTASAIIRQVIDGPPIPIVERNPQALRGLVAITEGAMGRLLRDRYACMADVLEDLNRVEAGDRPLGPRGASPSIEQAPEAHPAESLATPGQDSAEQQAVLAFKPLKTNLRWALATVALCIAVPSIALTWLAVRQSGRGNPGDLPQIDGRAIAEGDVQRIAPGNPRLPALSTAFPQVEIEAFRVKGWESATDKSGAGWLLGPSHPHAKVGEVLRIEAIFSAPVSCGLLRLYPDGSVERCFPKTDGSVEPVDRVSFPKSIDNNSYYSLEAPGIHGFVLLAGSALDLATVSSIREQADAMWKPIAGIAGQPEPGWRNDGMLLHPLHQERGGEVQGPRPPVPLNQLFGMLQAHPAVKAVELITFPVQARLPAAIANDPPGSLQQQQKRMEELRALRQKCRDAGDYSAALQASRQLVELQITIHGAGHWDVLDDMEIMRGDQTLAALAEDARIKVRQALRYEAQAAERAGSGALDQAHSLLKSARNVLREVLGKDDANTLAIFYQLGEIDFRSGRYDEAAEEYLQLLSAELSLHGERHPRTALARNNLGMMFQLLGDDKRALEHCSEALETAKRLKGAEDAETLTSLINQGVILEALDRGDEAENSYERVIEIDARAKTLQPSDLAKAYNNLAGVKYHKHQFDEAEKLNRKALALREKALPEGLEEFARSLDNLANVLDEQGKFGDAEGMHRKALDARLKAKGEDHPETVRSLCNLAYNLCEQKRDDEAEAAWTQAARSFGTARMRIASGGLDRVRFGTSHSPLTALAAQLARNRKPVEAWKQLESDLGRGLIDEQFARNTRPLPASQKKREEDLIAAVQNAKGDTRIALEAQLRSLERELAEKFGVAYGQIYSLDRVQAALQPDEAIVAWVDLPLTSRGDMAHWACLVRAQGDPVWTPLRAVRGQGSWTDDEKQLASKVAQLLGHRPAPEAEDWQTLAHLLAKQRLEPLRDQFGKAAGLPAVEHLIVLPSPGIDGVPVEVLLAAWKVEPRPQTVSYAPSATIHTWLREQRSSRARSARPSAAQTLLALGYPTRDPHADAVPSGLGGTKRPADRFQRLRDRLGPLPAAADEVLNIARLFPAPGTLKLLGSEATASRLDDLRSKGSLSEFDVIHLATHCTIEDRPLDSALLLATERVAGPGDEARPSSLTVDGVITAEQILRTWKLSADLVTLSACQTAKGRLEGGEGHLGFSQALFLAGAQSLILSLWRVDDEATALLMMRFYQEYAQASKSLPAHRRKAEALHKAQSRVRHITGTDASDALLHMRRVRGEEQGLDATLRPLGAQYEHPYYWAGFVLMGDPG